MQVNCPIRILHAYFDDEVDWESSLNLLKMVESDDVDLILRKSGNHRLMKPRDLTQLNYILDSLIGEYAATWVAEDKMREAGLRMSKL
jgi:abhydrolase domain-containing protein 10